MFAVKRCLQKVGGRERQREPEEKKKEGQTGKVDVANDGLHHLVIEPLEGLDAHSRESESARRVT